MKYIKSDRFTQSFVHACHGLRSIWRTEQNFRIQSLIAVALLLVVVEFHFSYEEAVAILLSCMIVLVSEGFNTAIEKNLDKVTPELHPVVGRIKDIMAGVVLIASSIAFVIGALTFWHHFLR